MPPPVAPARAVERIAAVCDGDHADERTLRIALLGEIRRLVGFDAFAWLLTDPETEVGSAPVADVPCLADLPRLVRLKYLTPVNRWTALPGAVATLRPTTVDARASSRLWDELLGPLGVCDVASVVFRDRFGCWGFLDLWRTQPNGGFDEAETAVLAAIAAPVTEALRRHQARSFTSPMPAQDRAGPAVLVLSADLAVVGQTPAADGYLRRLVPPAAGAAPVPAGAYNVAAQLLAAESGVDDHPARTRVHLGDGVWVTLRADRVDGRQLPPGGIAVSIEPATPAERTSLFARAWGFSPREAELLEHLAQGCDTRQLARRMSLSEHTVQDHLKSIFAKTGTASRRTLLARAIGR